MEKKKFSFKAMLKEAWRMFLVSLKRRPSMIALAVFLIAFLQYSLQLSTISNTTSKIQGSGMGLCGFVTMLGSMLSMLCFSNAFPKRKKTNIPMLVLMYAMNLVIIYCDYHYMNAILNAVNRELNPIQVTTSTIYIANAYSLLQTHIIILIVGIVLTALIPVYSKWIKKINTNIEVEGNQAMGEIDISGED